MKKHTKKISIILLFALLIIFLGALIADILLYVSKPRHPSFSDIEVLDIIRYDEIIEQMGEPNNRAINTLTLSDTSINIYALYYNEVIFHVHGEAKHVMYHDIIGKSHRLGGFARRSIGVGSTKREVEADFRRRSRMHTFWCEPPCGMSVLNSPASLQNAGFSYYHVRTTEYVDFEFDENDIVIRMRFGRLL